MKLKIRDINHARILNEKFHDRGVVEFCGVPLMIDEAGISSEWGVTSWDFSFVEVLRPSWNGSGTPPAGIEVEIHNENNLGIVPGAESFIGNSATVMSAFTNMHGYEMVTVEDGDGSCMCFRAEMCRPVRTPEQIAADDRNNGIEAILDDYTYTVGPCTHRLTRPQAARLYDAGYRKV